MSEEARRDPDLGRLSTEAVQARWREADLLSTVDLVRAMNEEDRGVPEVVGAAAEQIATAVDVVAAALDGGGRLVYVGAGTSGRMGVLDAVECPPTFDTDPGLVVGVLAGGEGAFISAVEGAEDDFEGGREAIAANRIGATDVVFGIAASGRTPFVLGAVAAARERGAVTIGLSCNGSAELSTAVDHPIEVRTGPEFLAGSTRLKAGTAQKLVLNTISTIAMIRIGKTFGNLMVDLRATNEKLRQRALRIVAEATGAGAEEARDALAAADGEVKTAIVVLLAGVEPGAARERLAASRGRVREALANAEGGASR